MKFIKKSISLFLTFIMLISAFVLPVSAQAASPKTLNISVSGTMVDSIVSSALNATNNYRTKNGREKLTLDKKLTEQARVRVTEIIFRGKTYDESVETLPDGSGIYSRFSDWGVSTFSEFGRLSSPTVDVFQSYLDSFCAYSSAASYRSLGVAVFTWNANTYFYLLASTKPATQTFSDFTNKSYSRTVAVSTCYVTAGRVEAKDLNGKGASALSLKVCFDGQCLDYVDVPNNQVKYSSSAPSYFKVKGYKGYSKKDGKASIYVSDLYGNRFLEQQINVYAYVSKPYWSYGFPKRGKKKVTCKWDIYSNVDGYQIQYSTKKNMKGAKTVTVKGKNSSKKVIKKLKSGKKYYFRLRAYVNQGDGEKLMGQWSEKKAVKVK